MDPNVFEVNKPCRCNEYNHVSKKNMHFANRRICLLARPKYKTKKIYRSPETRLSRDIQVLREQQISTRLNQLSYPKVGKLIAARQSYERFIDETRLTQFDRTISESQLTMYSRLHRVQMPEHLAEPAKRWSRQQWIKHYEWLSRRAQPKKMHSLPEEILSIKMPLDELLPRLETLAKPKFVFKHRTPLPEVSRSAIQYEATERIVKLAEPRRPRQKGRVIYSIFYRVKRGAKRFKITDRLENLARPKEVVPAESEFRENPFQVEPKALKATCSARTKTLAEPKKRK